MRQVAVPGMAEKDNVDRLEPENRPRFPIKGLQPKPCATAGCIFASTGLNTRIIKKLVYK